MSRRPALTIVLHLGSALVRADFTRNRSQSPRVHRWTVPEDADWISLVQTLVADRAPLGKQLVWLTTRAEPHWVHFPAASVAAMTLDELHQALQFEMETLTGIEIDDLAIASAPAHSSERDLRRFLVSVMRQSELKRLGAELAGQGVRHFQIGHPAGFGKAWGTDQEADTWTEIWGRDHFEFERASQRLRVLRRIGGDFTPAVVPIGWVSASSDSDTTIRVNQPVLEEGNLEHWLAGVRQVLDDKSCHAAWIRPPRAPSQFAWRPTVAALLALAAVFGCVTHWSWLSTQERRLAQRTESLSKPTEDKRRNETEQLKLLEQQTKLETDVRSISIDLKRLQFFHEHQIDRLPKLLTLLTELRTPDMVVQKLTPDPQGILVEGITLSGESAPLLANRLKLMASPFGWNVSAATQEGQQKMINGGPWTFKILLEDTGPFEFPVSESTPGNRESAQVDLGMIGKGIEHE